MCSNTSSFYIFWVCLIRLFWTEREKVLTIIGAAASKLKKEWIWFMRSGLWPMVGYLAACTIPFFHWRPRSGPFFSSFVTFVDQTKPRQKPRNQRPPRMLKKEEKGSMSGKIVGQITGFDLIHLLLLLLFLLFYRLDDKINTYDQRHGTYHVNPCHEPIKFVLVLLE